MAESPLLIIFQRALLGLLFLCRVVILVAGWCGVFRKLLGCCFLLVCGFSQVHHGRILPVALRLLGFVLVGLLGDFGFAFFAAEFHAVAQFVDGSAQSAFPNCSCAFSHMEVFYVKG
jgi:hypothetical protein